MRTLEDKIIVLCQNGNITEELASNLLNTLNNLESKRMDIYKQIIELELKIQKRQSLFPKQHNVGWDYEATLCNKPYWKK